MKPIKRFEEFIHKNIVKKQSTDNSRAKFLINESEKGYNCVIDMLSKLKITNDNANTFVKSCHDVLMELIRAKMLLEGYNAVGQGAHEAEVSFLRILDFDERDVQFADQIRFFRNGMMYYGTILDKEYADKVVEFTKRIYSKLRVIVK
ncbi:MAG: hypothetical protein AABX39_04945 [Nanoarchaeota archaeon]